MFIVVFKSHTMLNCETQYFGPYTDYLEAEDKLCTLDTQQDQATEHSTAVKYIATLEK